MIKKRIIQCHNGPSTIKKRWSYLNVTKYMKKVTYIQGERKSIDLNELEKSHRIKPKYKMHLGSTDALGLIDREQLFAIRCWKMKQSSLLATILTVSLPNHQTSW